MLIGYARVSTVDQNLDLQTDALTAAGCERIFCDRLSGTLKDRPELARALDMARSGDKLVVWRLDRLGRSLRNLVEEVGKLHDRNIEFLSLKESIDTSTPTGRLTFHLFAALAEFERDVIRERSAAGMAAARARGKISGRPWKRNAHNTMAARELHKAGMRIPDIGKQLGVSRTTAYRMLSENP